MRKGQIIGLEFMFALFILLLLMTVIAFSYLKTSKNLAISYTYDGYVNTAMGISDMLSKSSGYPESWNASTVKSLGLASFPGKISTSKVNSFVNLTYNQTKHLLGISSLEFFFQIRDSNGGNLVDAGLNPKENSQCYGDYEAVTSRRFAMWEGQLVTLYFTLWNDRCERNVSAPQTYALTQKKFIGVPEFAFEEDNSGLYSFEIQYAGDGRFAQAIDEGVVVPDYMQLDFGNLEIQPTKTIVNASLLFRHRDDPAAGAFPTGEDFRKKVYCWNGIWLEVGNYSISPDKTNYINTTLDLSSCVNSVSIANNIQIRINFDSAFNINGHQDIDYAEVTVNTN